MAQRGFEMLCIEPGPRLAELTRENLEALPGIEVHCQTFEDWPCEAAAFGLVISAQARNEPLWAYLSYRPTIGGAENAA